MKMMTTGISTSPHTLTKAVNESVSQAQRQQVRLAAPEVAMTGVPGEPDYKRGVTEPFKNIIPVHRNSGSAVVGGIAYRTNEKAWRDYNPGFFQGLFAPEGEYDSKPFYHTDLVAAASDPTLIKKATAKESEKIVYGEAATPNRVQARPVSTQLIQDADYS
jgi:hypothetical protein